MAKKSKVLKVAYYDETGKRRGKTFSAPTMHEARLKAAEWERTRPKEKKPTTTVLDAMAAYVELKRPVWSPGTTKAAVSIVRTVDSDPIAEINVHDLSSADLQRWVGEMTAKGLTLKTIKNMYGLILPAVRLHRPGVQFSVTFPQRQKKTVIAPSPAEVNALLNFVREQYGEGSDLELAIVLAATSGLRLGEICALTHEDAHGAVLTVNKGKVSDEYGEWHTKPPKTPDSVRTVPLSKEAQKLIRGRTGNLIGCNPRAMSLRFAKAMKKSGIRQFRFHDLRHFFASYLHAQNVPDQYIMHFGGWSTPHVLQAVYRNEITEERQKQAGRIADIMTAIR